MALCTVTGAVYFPSGELARSVTIKFSRVDKSVNAEYLGAVVPADVFVKTDRLGQVDFQILTGKYIMAVGDYSGGAVVPEELTANIADILTIAVPGEPLPIWLEQALAARDAALAAAGDAQDSADDAAASAVAAATAGSTAGAIAGAAAAEPFSNAASDSADLASGFADDAASSADEAFDSAAAAALSSASVQPYASYADALAAVGALPPVVRLVAATIAGREIRWVRQSGGPCLGGGWVPAGDVNAGHFNGDVIAAAAYAIANPKYEFYQSFMRTDVVTSASTPWLSVGPSGIARPKNHVFVRQDTAVRNDSVTTQIQRVVNTDDGITNPKALRVITDVNVDTAQTEWAISGEINSRSNTSSTGNTALSGVANKYGTASVFGGHLQAKDWNIFSSASDVTALVGAEINTPAVGLDHPTANNGLGMRRAWDVIARTNRQVPAWGTAAGNSGEAEIGAGIIIRNDNLTGGYFRYGMVIDDISQTGNPNKITTGMLMRTSGIDGLVVRGVNTGAAVRIAPTAPGLFGIRIQGVFTTSAIGLDTGAWLSMSTDGTRKMRYSSGTDSFEFYNGIDNRASLRMNATPALSLGGTQVVGTRRTGWAADTGTAKRTANVTYTATAGAVYTQEQVQSLMDAVRDLSQTVKAMKDDMIAHGMFGA